jgi:membrane-associated phospholipid phosphatase
MVLLFVFGGCFAGILAEKEALVALGDYLEIAIPCMSFALGILYKDRAGVRQFTHALIAMVAIVQGIKFLTENLAIGIRPYGGTKSFPSGHTAASFQGAFFLCKRYGWKWGMPAVALAALTAYSRVYGQYHHWRDAIAGLTIAFLINALFVKSLKKSGE